MKLLMFLFIPVIVFSQEAEEALDKLLKYKHEKINIQINYSPFKKKVIENESKEFASSETVKKTGDIVKAIFNNRAFINNKWYTIGDEIGSFKILKISKDTVYMSKGNTLKNLQLKNFKKYIVVKEK